MKTILQHLNDLPYPHGYSPNENETEVVVDYGDFKQDDEVYMLIYNQAYGPGSDADVDDMAKDVSQEMNLPFLRTLDHPQILSDGETQSEWEKIYVVMTEKLADEFEKKLQEKMQEEE